MKKYALALLVLSSCATTYQEGAKSDYIGNGLYEVTVSGTHHTESDVIRGFIYRKAFDVCAEKSKGFEIVEKVDKTPSKYWNPIAGQMVNKEAYRMVVKCEGAIDQELVKKYSDRSLSSN